MSSHSIICGFQVPYQNSREKKDVVIDSNKKIQELLERQANEYQKKLKEEERARRIAELEASGETVPEGMDPDEFLGLADTIMKEEVEEEQVPEIDFVAEAQQKAQEILEEAQAKADEILAAAQSNAEQLKITAQDEGFEQGYQNGLEKAETEIAQAQSDLMQQAMQLEQEYEQRAESLERDVVDGCMDVFQKVFNAQLEGNKDVILHLLKQCVMHIERTKELHIHVSEANIGFVKSKKEEIMEKVGADVQIDFISDPTLNDSQCIVDTDGGIFDCSIDTELDGLCREIKALS